MYIYVYISFGFFVVRFTHFLFMYLLGLFGAFLATWVLTLHDIGCTPLMQVIKGWTEAMQMMKEGDKWELYIPSELAYGESQRGQYITPGAVLVFELEIVKVKGPSKQL